MASGYDTPLTVPRVAIPMASGDATQRLVHDWPVPGGGNPLHFKPMVKTWTEIARANLHRHPIYPLIMFLREENWGGVAESLLEFMFGSPDVHDWRHPCHFSSRAICGALQLNLTLEQFSGTAEQGSLHMISHLTQTRWIKKVSKEQGASVLAYAVKAKAVLGDAKRLLYPMNPVQIEEGEHLTTYDIRYRYVNTVGWNAALLVGDNQMASCALEMEWTLDGDKFESKHAHLIFAGLEFDFIRRLMERVSYKLFYHQLPKTRSDLMRHIGLNLFDISDSDSGYGEIEDDGDEEDHIGLNLFDISNSDSGDGEIEDDGDEEVGDM